MNEATHVLQYNRLYNFELKKYFIEQYDSMESKLTFYWQFLKITETEKKKNKDLCNMNFEEIKQILKNIECSTINSAINHINTYKRYIQLCLDLGHTKNNPLAETEIPLSALAKEVVANEKNMRYTREELIFMIDELVNFTDGALLLALFEGIKGKGFCELLSLKTSNLEETKDGYVAHLYDLKGQKTRTINISRELFNLLLIADKQPSYRTNNEEEDVETPFNESEYIFKKAKKGKQYNSQMLDRHFITRKFLFFKKFFGNEHLRADDIVQSGMMDMAYRLYKENGKIGKEELLKIGEQYDTIMATADGKNYYRNTTHLRRLIFTESFKKLYGNIEYKN